MIDDDNTQQEEEKQSGVWFDLPPPHLLTEPRLFKVKFMCGAVQEVVRPPPHNFYIKNEREQQTSMVWFNWAQRFR